MITFWGYIGKSFIESLTDIKALVYIELFIVIFLVGTKTLFIGIIITLLYLYYRHLRYAYVVVSEKKNKVFDLYFF